MQRIAAGVCFRIMLANASPDTCILQRRKCGLPGHLRVRHPVLIGDSAHIVACVVQRSMGDAKGVGLCRGRLKWLPPLAPVVAQWLRTLQSTVKHVMLTGHTSRVLGTAAVANEGGIGRQHLAIHLKQRHTVACTQNSATRPSMTLASAGCMTSTGGCSRRGGSGTLGVWNMQIADDITSGCCFLELHVLSLQAVAAHTAECTVHADTSVGHLDDKMRLTGHHVNMCSLWCLLRPLQAWHPPAELLHPDLQCRIMPLSSGTKWENQGIDLLRYGPWGSLVLTEHTGYTWRVPDDCVRKPNRLRTPVAAPAGARTYDTSASWGEPPQHAERRAWLHDRAGRHVVTCNLSQL